MKSELEIVKFGAADIVLTSNNRPGACGDLDSKIDVPCAGPLD